MRTEKGAEATVEIKEDRVVKKREPKNYRNEKLDNRLRTERTEQEQKLVEKAIQYNVNAPETEKVDESTLEQQKIEGTVLKEKVVENPSLLEQLGENVAYLHSADIIHGDLTTSNAIFSNGEIFVIDFGLSFQSQRKEDRAVDIHLLKQVLNSSNPETAEEAWQSFLEGYKEYESSEEVLEQLEEVEQRGRYK